MQNKPILLLLLSLFVYGCAVGPDYVKPQVAVPTHYKETAKNWKVAKPQDKEGSGQWWLVFHDKKLNALEEQLIQANQSIVNAEANYRQALALVDEARANYFPVGTVTADITRQKRAGGATPFISTSSTGATSVGTAATGGSSTSNSAVSTGHSLTFTSTWEPDLWGSVRRTVETNRAAAEASQDLLAQTRLSATASLAQIYFQVRALDTDQQLLDETATNYRKTLKLTQFQYHSGVAAEADVVSAQTQLEAAEAAAINNKTSRAQYEHAIAVLIGKAPADFSLAKQPLTTRLPHIPAQVPSTLLERRPDIAQAERLMAQANAQIGVVAVAAYFPALTLSATGTVTNSGYANWFSLPALGWALGPELAQTLFDGGLRKATIKAARASYDATVASYRQTVLTAFQDVEDNLAALRVLQAEWIVQNKAAADSAHALRLVINQYRAGTVPYSSVVTAQTTAYAAAKNAADVKGLQTTSTVGLIKALGGVW
jgi:NodT family efflux transporter outer membrane factor (OMF) lipoprotein